MSTKDSRVGTLKRQLALIGGRTRLADLLEEATRILRVYPELNNGRISTVFADGVPVPVKAKPLRKKLSKARRAAIAAAMKARWARTRRKSAGRATKRATNGSGRHLHWTQRPENKSKIARAARSGWTPERRKKSRATWDRKKAATTLTTPTTGGRAEQ